ncbi:MAG TPA: winged helix-turn-helix domain-containing protein [Blastocatellia bacterium]|jgi:DNA-binding winged helix-turn-helix (wHTH) protein/tetratricopeptide (TPR) repeat protein|nr:winged helix-turn-helix domain-containing protein [Blastocatellia bacterium]
MAGLNRETKHFYEFGPFRLDPGRGELFRGGEIVSLPPKVFDILLVLVEAGGEIVQKDELMQKVWPDSFVEEGNLSVNIFALRKALGDDGNRNLYIKTAPKRGYRFVADVRQLRNGNAEGNGECLESTESAPVQTHTDSGGPGASQPMIEREMDRVPALPVLPDRALEKEFGVRPSMQAIATWILLLGITATFAYFWASNNSSRPIKAQSVAVLPFKTISTESDDEYLGAAIADETIAALTRLKEITVRPISASIKYGKPGQDPVEAGRALRADAVLEGSIRRVGGSLRITAQLIRVQDGSRIFEVKNSEEFHGAPTVQSTMPERVARALGLDLTDQDKILLARQHTDSVEAFQLYLRGRYLCGQKTWKEVSQGIECLERAITLDPNYALARSALAYSQLQLSYPPATINKMQKAKAEATRALELDNTLAEAHTALGRALTFCDWDWAGAEQEFKRAVELSPNYSEAHFWYAQNLSSMGRHDEAISELRWAQEVDPFSPRFNLRLGWTFYFARRYDEAIEQFRKTPLEIDSVTFQVFWRLGLVYTQKSMYGEAAEALQKAAALAGDRPLTKASLGYLYSRSGDDDRARKVVTELSGPIDPDDAPYLIMAALLAQLDDKDKAFEWLEKAYNLSKSRIVDVKVDPMLDGLRSDPRFDDLLRKIGLGR